MFPLDVFTSNGITLFRIYCNSRTPDICFELSFLLETSTYHARGNIIRGKTDVFLKITLEGLRWVEGQHGGFVLRALSSLGKIIFTW